MQQRSAKRQPTKLEAYLDHENELLIEKLSLQEKLLRFEKEHIVNIHVIYLSAMAFCALVNKPVHWLLTCCLIFWGGYFLSNVIPGWLASRAKMTKRKSSDYDCLQRETQSDIAKHQKSGSINAGICG